jgi:hypothetical protein
VESQVHLHQPHDVVDDRRRVPKRLEPISRHASAHHLVMVELHALWGDLTSARLPHVVQQRGEAKHGIGLASLHHGIGVAEDILVFVNRVLLQPQRRKLGEDQIREARPDRELQPPRRHRRHQQLVELVADPLRRHDLDPLAHVPHRSDDAFGGRDLELGGEPRGTEHAQRVVRERRLGIPRRIQAPSGEIAHAPERIHERSLRQPQGHRVDREVAARQVRLDVARERHRRFAVLLGVHLLAKRGDLEQPPVLACAHGAEPHPDEVLTLCPPAQDPRRLVRRRIRREVEVAR